MDKINLVKSDPRRVALFKRAHYRAPASFDSRLLATLRRIEASKRAVHRSTVPAIPIHFTPYFDMLYTADPDGIETSIRLTHQEARAAAEAREQAAMAEARGREAEAAEARRKAEWEREEISAALDRLLCVSTVTHTPARVASKKKANRVAIDFWEGDRRTGSGEGELLPNGDVRVDDH